MKTARKPKLAPKPERKIKVVTQHGDVDCYTVRITVGDEVDYYEVTAADAQFGPLWLVRKLSADLEAVLGKPPYKTVLDGEFGSSCDCPAGKWRGKCRHVEGLSALVARGKLPDLCLRPQPCPVCHGQGGPATGDADSDGCACRECGE